MASIVVDSSVVISLYVALGLREGCPFVTADERLVNSVAVALPHVVWLGAWSSPADSADVAAP